MYANPRIRGFLMATPLDEGNVAHIVQAFEEATRVTGWRNSARDDWQALPIRTFGPALYLRTELGRRVALHPDEDGDLELDWSFEGVAPGPPALAVLTRLVQSFPGRVRAYLQFDDAELGASPRPPLAAARTVVAYPTSLVESYYPSVDAYVAAFDGHHRIAESVVCFRGLGTTDVPAALFTSNWRLARISAPGSTEPLWVVDPRTDGERTRVEAEPGRLHWNGYNETEQAHAYTVGQGRLAAREVVLLGTLIRRGTDGERPVRSVRVHFFDRADAEREARPLLDSGVEVLYLDEDGEYRPVELSTGPA